MNVLIPTANNPTDLVILLVQLQQQTLLPDKIYIADNSREQYVIKLASRYHWRIPTYIDSNPGSIYQSWNKGIGLDESDVVILNDDLMIPCDFIERIHAGFEDGHHCLCPSSPGFPPTRTVRRGYHWDRAGLYQSYNQVTKKLVHSHVPLLTGWCFGLSRELIKKIGLFDEQFQIWYGDTDMSKRIEDVGYSHVFINELFVHHFGSSSFLKIDRDLFNATNYEDQVRYEQKHGMEHQDLGWDKYA